jgi:hypothetical protein
MQGAATQAMWFIVDERQRHRSPPRARRAPKGGWHEQIEYAMNPFVTFIISGAGRKM